MVSSRLQEFTQEAVPKEPFKQRVCMAETEGPTTEQADDNLPTNIGSIGPLGQLREAKSYMNENSIPQMFECLLASLMLEQPDDHVTFLDQKMNAIKEVGTDNINWQSFIEQLHPHRDPLRRQFFGEVHQNRSDKRSFSRDDTASSELFHLTEAQD